MMRPASEALPASRIHISRPAIMMRRGTARIMVMGDGVARNAPMVELVDTYG